MNFDSCFIFIPLFLISFVVKSQETKDSIPKFYNLNSTQYNAWKIIEQEWMQKEYGKILKENKLKMSCNGCENIYMDAIIAIDNSGKLKEYKIVKTRKCSQEFSKKLETRFIKWFIDLKFPAELFNSKFEIRLGTGLKC